MTNQPKRGRPSLPAAQRAKRHFDCSKSEHRVTALANHLDRGVNTMSASKVTMATIKSFVRKNQGKLYIRFISDFDDMTDCVQPCADRGFTPAQASEEGGFQPDANGRSNTLGIKGAWFVGQSRDYLEPIAKDGFVGYHVYNCCGAFDLAVRA